MNNRELADAVGTLIRTLKKVPKNDANFLVRSGINHTIFILLGIETDGPVISDMSLKMLKKSDNKELVELIIKEDGFYL